MHTIVGVGGILPEVHRVVHLESIQDGREGGVEGSIEDEVVLGQAGKRIDVVYVARQEVAWLVAPDTQLGIEVNIEHPRGVRRKELHLGEVQGEVELEQRGVVAKVERKGSVGAVGRRRGLEDDGRRLKWMVIGGDDRQRGGDCSPKRRLQRLPEAVVLVIWIPY